MVMSDLYKFQYPDMFPDIVVQFLVPKTFPVPNFMSTIMGIIFGTVEIFTQRTRRQNEATTSGVAVQKEVFED